MARDFSKTAANNLDLGALTIGTLLNGATKISVHAWINPDSYDTANNDNRILSVAIQNGTGGLTLSINNPAGTPVVRVAGRSVVTDSYQTKDGTTNITTGSWWSVGGVNNISGDTITPYVNGETDAATLRLNNFNTGVALMIETAYPRARQSELQAHVPDDDGTDY